jgi:formimidoylglutamate deiminase
MPERTPTAIWAPRAWLPAASSTAGHSAGGWQSQVLLQIGADGRWAAITPGVAQPPVDAQVLTGPLLPGLVNAHSHAFQRAFAGLAERRETESDDFWSWRDRMYRVALRITPDQLQAIAAMLYLELLRGGYTQVCEFHYLQHRPDGRPYADPLALGWALADAAAEAGMGLTLMPALYERAGFTQPTLRDDQRRFATTADSVWAAAQRIAASGRPLLNAGLVLHSLRAAAPESVHRLRRLAEGFAGAIHIHVAEQTAEVDDCLLATGQRTIAWLAGQGLLDARWQLVHATHTVPAEIDAVARSGAGVVICPSTEANLGDGLCDLSGWLNAGVPLAIGSDSHVSRDWREELRWLDYGQRLALRRRNVSAAPADGQPATAQRLFSRALAAGGAACGESSGGLVVGARADALLADPADPALLGLPPDHWLDAQVFSSPVRPWQAVMVAGRWVISDHRHPLQHTIARRFEAAMAALWQGH